MILAHNFLILLLICIPDDISRTHQHVKSIHIKVQHVCKNILQFTIVAIEALTRRALIVIVQHSRSPQDSVAGRHEIDNDEESTRNHHRR